MHELSIAQALIEQVRDATAEQKPLRVVSIRVVVGTLSGVDPDALRLAFPLAAEETALAGAELEIDLITAAVRCARCGQRSTPEPPFAYCVACGHHEVTIEAGRELYIASAEIETEDGGPGTAGTGKGM